jgi:hypothetical protein
LISYPYYTKLTQKGDYTFFRHINCNIADAVKTRNGVNMIQGSVSWDSEDDKNCTQMLIGFHNIIEQYQAWREKSSVKESTGYIEQWKDDTDFPPECRQRFPGVRWSNEICNAGQVRISSPLLPHGSTGPATKMQRTMLPWFVRVHPDMKTMEVPEMGSYADIATAHQQLTAAPTSPSGHPNRYSGVNWAFPADINPIFTSPISQAINCQLLWDSPLVQVELHRLFSKPDPSEINRWIDDTRLATVRTVKKHWVLAKAREIQAFMEDEDRGIPSRSYFTNRGVYPPPTAEWWVYDGQVTQATAIDQLRDEISLTQEERAVFRAESRARSQSLSRHGTSSPVSSPSQSDILSPRHLSTPQACPQALSLNALVLQTPQIEEEDDDNITPMNSPSRPPRGGPSLGSPEPRRSERLRRAGN